MTPQERAGFIVTSGILIIVWLAAVIIVSYAVTYGIAALVGH